MAITSSETGATPAAKDPAYTHDYIGKCAEQLHDTQHSMNSVALLLIIVSFVMSAVAAGIISVDQEISVIGLKLRVPSSIILSAGGWSIAGLYSYFVGLKIREYGFIDTIHRLYRELSYSDVSFEGKSASPFDPASVVDIPILNWENESSFFGKLLYGLNGLLILILILLVPLVVQILIAYRMFSLFRFRWWIVLSEFVLLFVTASNAFLFAKKTGE